MSAWLALARQRGVSDREYRLGVELWTFAGRELQHGQPRCWRDGEGWAYKVWPRIEPKDADPPEKQANALTRRMGCKRRKVEQALSGLCKKALIRRAPRPGGPPGKRERLNLHADTILLVPDSASKAASPHVSNIESARSGQSDTHKRAEPNQLSQSTFLKQTNPPSIDAQQQPFGVGLDCLAKQAAEPAESSDPARPVESDETADTRVEEHAWGESGPELSDLRPWMVEEAVAAHPNLAAHRHDSTTMLNAFRLVRGYSPGSTIRNVERMVEIGMRRTDAERIAREYEFQPNTLRDMIDAVRAAARSGGIGNQAGLLIDRLKKAKAKRSGGYSAMQ